ncbi:uncharacterized protein J4E79_003628 [Alternaria viburni]|uniref:uncharacterized protein n=1 Tax=Alternaria viburni TaxID=566460 RepID=UPI0020C5611C|nr:uncharacterized protein J4E79_003628 [Alternaria viburni]KAI4664127.1 hypothetical protein J4E79_003628 [Alternaria viburni]
MKTFVAITLLAALAAAKPQHYTRPTQPPPSARAALATPPPRVCDRRCEAGPPTNCGEGWEPAQLGRDVREH